MGAGITSTANPLVREVLRLKEGRRDRTGEVIIVSEGPHLVETALDCPAAGLRMAFFTERFYLSAPGRQLMDRLKETHVRMVEASQKVIDKLSDTETPQGIVAVLSLQVPSLDTVRLKACPMLAVCDGINDPGNIGTIVRAADAAGADAVLLTPGTCDAYAPKAVRASAGSIFSVPVLTDTGVEEIGVFLAERGIGLYAADVRAAHSLYETDFRRPAAIVFGNEAHGIGRALLDKADYRFSIPVIGRAESLNVAMAASISLYEAVRQRRG